MSRMDHDGSATVRPSGRSIFSSVHRSSTVTRLPPQISFQCPARLVQYAQSAWKLSRNGGLERSAIIARAGWVSDQEVGAHRSRNLRRRVVPTRIARLRLAIAKRPAQNGPRHLNVEGRSLLIRSELRHEARATYRMIPTQATPSLQFVSASCAQAGCEPRRPLAARTRQGSPCL